MGTHSSHTVSFIFAALEISIGAFTIGAFTNSQQKDLRTLTDFVALESASQRQAGC